MKLYASCVVAALLIVTINGLPYSRYDDGQKEHSAGRVMNIHSSQIKKKGVVEQCVDAACLTKGGDMVAEDAAIAEIKSQIEHSNGKMKICLLYTSPSPRDATLSRMPSSA